MRRLAVPLTMLVLAGCSGFGQFTRHTFTIPGANPALPAGSSENMSRVESAPTVTSVPPLETEAGNVWPGPPKPFPTLSEVEKQTQNGQVAMPYSSSGEGSGPGRGPSAFSPSNDQTSGSKYKMQSNPNAPSTITIPNGNGTSTVIGPDGSVKVIPTPKGEAPTN
jgi:hypothetical protein